MIPVWSTHNHATEGGRKIHLLTQYGENSLCGVPERHRLLTDAGEEIADVAAYLRIDVDGEVCGICRRRALALIAKESADAR